MPRPQPIIVPGPSGMGGSMRESHFELIPKEVGMALLGELLGAWDNSREGKAKRELYKSDPNMTSALGEMSNSQIARNSQELNKLYQSDMQQKQMAGVANNLIGTLSQRGNQSALTQEGPTLGAAEQGQKNTSYLQPFADLTKAGDPQGALAALTNFMMPLSRKEQAGITKTEQEIAHNKTMYPLEEEKAGLGIKNTQSEMTARERTQQREDEKLKREKYKEVGVSEKGGLTVSYDPLRAKNFITKPDGSFEDYNAKKHGKIMSSTLSQTTIYNNQQAQSMSPDALRLAGIQWATTGQMPALGMGGAGAKIKVMNAGAAYLKEQGINPTDVPAMQGEYKSARETYTTLKKGTEAISTFDSGMRKNMDYAEQVSKNFPRTSYPAANKLINAMKYHTGDKKVVELGNAIYSASLEFEKIRTAGTNISAAELSVGAQAKAEDLINKAQTHDQLLSGMKAMKTDATNVMASKREGLKNMDEEMKTLGGYFEGKGKWKEIGGNKALPKGFKEGW